MLLTEILFFFCLSIIVYSYLGYGLLLWLIVRIKKIFKPKKPETAFDLPPVTLIVAAYNEADFITDKINNSLSLDYPKDKLNILFITDGSTDDTYLLASQFEGIQVLHSPERKGKIAAIHRAMDFVKTPIIVFSDANTLLNPESIKKIVAHYQLPNTGGVAGEKKILTSKNDKGPASGEGLYWKYESFLKKLDAELYTVVGAAGELFSIRTELYEYTGTNVLLDDFIISLRVCKKGFRIAYEPGAYAMEEPSSSIAEEQKRKVRISAGAFQSMVMLKDLLNIFKYPVLSFQYISHRVLRWTLCPLFLPLVLLLNIYLVIKGAGIVYTVLLIAQLLFYGAALFGWILSIRNIKAKMLYAPYYFVFLNVSLYLGFIRYLKGNQTVLWDKAIRQKNNPTIQGNKL
jgi:cellulose synthase/poly-beta-1,6-N-acetylglucosamine synthase-like glycosyltransferase